jgi:hypothetical protein
MDDKAFLRIPCVLILVCLFDLPLAPQAVSNGLTAATASVWDFSSATSLKVPASSGTAPTLDGLLSFDFLATTWCGDRTARPRPPPPKPAPPPRVIVRSGMRTGTSSSRSSHPAGQPRRFPVGRASTAAALEGRAAESLRLSWRRSISGFEGDEHHDRRRTKQPHRAGQRFDIKPSQWRPDAKGIDIGPMRSHHAGNCGVCGSGISRAVRYRNHITAVKGLVVALSSASAGTNSYQFIGTLTGARTVNLPDANSSAAQGFTSPSNQFVTAFNAITGTFAAAQSASSNLSDAANLVKNNQGNTYTAGDQSFTGATSLEVPVAAGLTAAVNGRIGYDSTGNQVHAAINSAAAIIPTRGLSTPASGNCVKLGANGQLQDQGSTCNSSSDYQKQTGALTGNSADQTIFTTTLPGGALAGGSAWLSTPV